MQDLLNSKFNSERNLSELFITLWAYKLLIAFTCALGIVFGVYYIMNTDKKFRSTAIFKQDQAQSRAFQLSGELGALGQLAGINSGPTKLGTSKEQIFGLIFIKELDTQLSFQADPYFNTYNPNSVDPAWKSLIKRAISWKKYELDIQQVIWQSIKSNFSKSVEFITTENGSTMITVTHIDPQRAAEIANTIMDQILSNAKNKKDSEKDEQLSYLSNTLAKALIDLELAQSNLKQFTLKNSALPLENFTLGSLQLDVLREQFTRTSELYEAVDALLQILQNKTTKQENYLALRKKFPIVDQVEFRQVLGQTEIISSWSWPEASSVEAVLDTLSERKSRLKSQINASKIEAERSSLLLETYAKLEREAKVAEATYTVLIEQVKAQNMAAGYRPDNTTIYEYATASTTPSTPKRNLILALGAMLGVFLGTALSLILAHHRDVYYSKNSLRTAVQARFTASVKSLLPLRNKSLNKINKILIQKPRPILRDIAVAIHKSDLNHVVITSSRSKLSSNIAAKALASYMQSETMNIAIIDFSSKTNKPNIDSEQSSIGSFIISEHVNHISVLRTGRDSISMDFLAQRDFQEQISTLSSTFNLVFLCADNDDSISLLSALEGQKLFHITLARRKKTKSATIAQMVSYLPIQGLLDD